MKSAKVEGHTIYEPKLSIGSSRQLIAPVQSPGMTHGRSGLAESCNSRTFLEIAQPKAIESRLTSRPTGISGRR